VEHEQLRDIIIENGLATHGFGKKEESLSTIA